MNNQKYHITVSVVLAIVIVACSKSPTPNLGNSADLNSTSSNGLTLDSSFLQFDSVPAEVESPAQVAAELDSANAAIKAATDAITANKTKLQGSSNSVIANLYAMAVQNEALAENFLASKCGHAARVSSCYLAVAGLAYGALSAVTSALANFDIAAAPPGTPATQDQMCKTNSSALADQLRATIQSANSFMNSLIGGLSGWDSCVAQKYAQEVANQPTTPGSPQPLSLKDYFYAKNPGAYALIQKALAEFDLGHGVFYESQNTINGLRLLSCADQTKAAAQLSIDFSNAMVHLQAARAFWASSESLPNGYVCN